MNKTLFIFLVMLLLGTSSFIKPGLLKQIVRCNVEVDPNEIYPGNTVDLILNTTLIDSTQIWSTESNVTINFADYLFELEGGAVLHEKARTKMTLRIRDDAFMNPFVHIAVKLKRKKNIRWEAKLPILYDVTQKVKFIGGDGYDPRSTTDDGYKSIPITKRVNIQFVDNTQTLTNNSDPKIEGGRGTDLMVFVSLLDTLESGKFIRVLIRDEKGTEITKYLRPGVGKLEIETVGGKGGISKSGGKGGKGGDVTVYLRPEAKPYFNQIFIFNFGGEGGELWRPKVDGQQAGPYGDDGELKVVLWD